MVKRRVVLLVFTLVFIVFVGVLPIENCIAGGNTIYVDDSGGAEYTIIQDAIDNASEGDSIYVYSGTYDSIVILGEYIGQLTLIGEDKDTTIIDGGNSGHVVRAYETQVSGNKIEIHISGFTIRNAGGNGFDCISLSYAENSTIIGNKLINGDVGEGVQLDHCKEITIQGNTISNCQGAGISLSISDNNVIENNLIQNNQKAIHLSSTSNNNIISNNTIKDNSQYGVYIVQSINNRFYYNDFIDNGQNAQDLSTNYWSYNLQGNYWDDYNGYDNNSDDIGDIPYGVPGGDNQDEYPLGYFKEPELPSGNQLPTAYLPSISPNPAKYMEIVSFSGSGSDDDGYIVGYNWRSSIDGQLSTQSTFGLSSLSAGTHTIYFKVKDNNDDWSSEKTATLTINCIENQAPTAYIDFIIPNPATSGEKVYFIGHGTDDGEIIGWKWISTIDGVINSNRSFNSSVLSTGAHTINFQVMDNDNEWSEQDIETLIINHNSSQHTPIANAGGPYSSGVNEEINFNGSASYHDGQIIEYLWDFGDGTTGTGESQIHTYIAPGNYSIMLTVTDENGNTSTDSTYVTIAQSTNQGSSSEGSPSFEFQVPFPIVIALEFLSITVIIALFLFWIKRK
ncbi:MAG: PKD domain-containing protein [Thermoplasmatales archaeon]|nr:MAG: PKD domain-containing protein [Thermoplasmatales archaeon]